MATYAVIDVETTPITDGEQPRTLFWGLADDKGYYRFDKTSQLMTYLTSVKEPYNLLHHSNFDVIQALKDGADLQILRSHNTKLIMTKWGIHTGLNTHAMFPVALAALFKAYGFTKSSLDDLEKRNYEDCVNGLKCFLAIDEEFLRRIGQSPLLRHTIAATGFAAAEAEAGRLPKDLSYLEAYRGGRVEIFDLNHYEEAFNYDINSSYPESFRQAPKIGNLLFCRVDTDDYYSPFFDSGTTERLLFPNGQFTTWIYEDNLERYVLPHTSGKLTIIKKFRVDLSWLNRVVPVIDKLYQLKAESPKDGAAYLVAKFGLNAMYGRIGLRGESEMCRITNYPWTGDNCTVCQLDWKRFICWKLIRTEPRSNYGIAAYITDNARARLYDAFVRTNALYGDTDSVWVKPDSTPPNPLGSKLGEWKLSTVGEFQGRNLKDYVVDGVRHVKGGVCSLQWTLKRMSKGQGAVEIKKTFSEILTKRQLNSDGTTAPFIL